jgi:hypothetical protein
MRWLYEICDKCREAQPLLAGFKMDDKKYVVDGTGALDANSARVEIARLTEEVGRLHSELTKIKALGTARLNTELRVVSRQPELVDVRVEVPPSGGRVIGLTKGGCLIPTIWAKSQTDFIGAWMGYPTVPESVKHWLSQAWREPDGTSKVRRHE